MVARVTLAELDTVRQSVDEAVARFAEQVLPSLHEQKGYEGVFVLTTPEGKALVMSFWASDEDAEAGLASGYYAEQVERFVTFFRAPAGRENYTVALAESPAAAIA